MIKKELICKGRSVLFTICAPIVGAAISICTVILFSAFFPVAVSHQQKKEAMLKAAMGEDIVPTKE